LSAILQSASTVTTHVPARYLLDTAGISSAAIRSFADPFSQQLYIAIVTPIVAAVFGGLVVGLIVQQVQNRRELVTLRTNLSVEMTAVAYDFYTRLIEVVRQQHYGRYHGMRRLLHRNTNLTVRGNLAEHFERFRISARAIEARLHAYFSDDEARYLWHGVVDMLSVRYYRLTYGASSQRLIDMMKVHAQHPQDEDIPTRVRAVFLNYAELQDDDKVMRRFEEMLNNAIYLVLNRKLDPAASGDAILQPGRGSRLGSVTS
jgi:hypothetical protein